MSVQSEITRIQTARNTLRTKAVSLGVGLATDNLTELATKYNGITDRGTPNAEVREGESYTIEAGYYHGGTVQGVSGGGNYNLQAKTVTPTKEEQSIVSDAGYYGLSGVTINPIPDAYQDVTDVDAAAGDVLAGKTIVTANGTVTAGTMPNRGTVNQTLTTSTKSYTIPAGYHSGSGKVQIVTETQTATPSTSTQNITPTTGKLLEKVTVNPIPGNYGDATNKTITAGDVLVGKTAIGWNDTDKVATSITGTMPNNGSVNPTALNAGGSYTIPAGYHDGTGKVTTKSLSSQTGVDSGKTAVAAAQMLTGYQAWVNGTKVTGTMANNGAITGTITGLGSVTGDTTYSIPAGYTTGGTVSLTSDIETALSAI